MDIDDDGSIGLEEWRMPDYSRYVGLPLEAARALARSEDRRHGSSASMASLSS